MDLTGSETRTSTTPRRILSGTIAATNDNGIGVAGVAGGKHGKPGVSLMINTVFGKTNVAGFEDALVYGADMGGSPLS